MRQRRSELDRCGEEAECTQGQQDGQFPEPSAALLAVIASSEQDYVKPTPRQPNGTSDIERMIGAVAHPESSLHSVELFLREASRHIRGYAGQKPGAKRASSVCRGSFWESRGRKQSRGSHSARVRSNSKRIVNKRSKKTPG
jgi:hypothetical protein